MPRLSKAEQTSRTMKAKGPRAKAKTKKPKWTIDDEPKLIEKYKIELLNHPATNHYDIGGKDGGKTRQTIVRKITLLEGHKDAQALDLKKYKGGATSRLHTANSNIALEIKSLGFDIPEYQKGVSETYRMYDRRFKQNNQTIEYASFDDVNGLAGIEAKNNGFFAIVHIEEPVLLDDEGKLPTKEEWKAYMSTIRKSVARSNRKWMVTHPGETIPGTKYFYTMNSWDDHPIITEAERVFPEATFLEFAKQDYFKNHTKAAHDAKTDSLYTRTTTLANPIINIIEQTLKAFKIKDLSDFEAWDTDKVDWNDKAYKKFNITPDLIKVHMQGYDGMSIWFQIEEALRTEDSLMLASLLGLKYTGTTANTKTWNLKGMVLGDVRALIKDTDTIVDSLSVAWDIDLRNGRKLVATPSYKVRRKVGFDTYTENILIGEQRVIQTYGDGIQKQKLYTERMLSVQDEIRDELVELSKTTKFRFGTFLYVDENKLNFLLRMEKQFFYRVKAKAVKHGSWDIMHRQDNIQLGIDTGYYIFDVSNVPLINEMRISIIKEGFKQRDESGKLEKNYDRINSFEYSLYPYRMNVFMPRIIIGKIKGGIWCQ